jgi:hypothetical protein
VRFAEGQVGGDRDGGPFFAFGDDLKEQFGSARVDLDVSELIELSRYRHSSIYADPVTMPRVWRCEPETMAAAY